MNAFLTDGMDLGLSDICRVTGLDKSAVQRFTNTLTQLGYLEKDPRTRRYKHAVKMLDWSVACVRSDRLIQIAGRIWSTFTRKRGRRSI